MIRFAPICLADSIPSNPTAPSPTTATVEPGFTFAASAANQPVPMTSESVNKLGIKSSEGISGVATKVPSASGTRSTGACAPPTSSRCWQDDWYPISQLGQVLSEAKNEPMTNWPGLTDLTALPTSSTMPQYSWPIGVGWAIGWIPRYGHRSDPHTHVAEILMMASVGLMILGTSRSSKRTSRGPYRTAPSIVISSYFAGLGNTEMLTAAFVLSVRCSHHPRRAPDPLQNLRLDCRARARRRQLPQRDPNAEPELPSSSLP